MEYLYLTIFWILYFILHSILAGNSSKNYVKNKFPSIFPLYRIFYNLFALGSLFFVLLYQNSVTPNTLFQGTIISQTIGGAILFIGIILGIIAFKNYSGLEFLGLDFNKQSNRLNTSGFNKFVRHPLYFSTLLIIWGYFLSDSKATILIMNCIITLYLIIGTRLEEQKLIKEFGKDYRQYIKDVPMLLPMSIFKTKKEE